MLSSNFIFLSASTLFQRLNCPFVNPVGQIGQLSSAVIDGQASGRNVKDDLSLARSQPVGVHVMRLGQVTATDRGGAPSAGETKL